MECLVGIGASVVGKLAEYTVEPVFRRVGYFFYYKRNMERLKEKVQDLKFAKERIDHSVAAARDNCGIIEGDVQHWLCKVDSINEEADKLLPTAEDLAENSCFSRGSFTGMIKRYKTSKEAKNTVDVIAATVEKAKTFGNVSYRLPLSNSLKIKGYEKFETRASVFEEIMEALGDVRVRTVGVWGMGGVGKTMLAKEVARQAKSENLFSRVVFTTVSQTPDSKGIQQEVAETLGLRFEETTVTLRAKRLQERLKSEEKILVVLDDIWSSLDLDEVGLSFADDQKACKILLTSRSQYAFSNEMGIHRSFNLGVLSEFEATDLFDEIVGDSGKEHKFQKVKKKILKKCAGLPLAISIIAKALKGESISIWEDALQELRTSNPVNTKGVEKEVYSVIRWSYDFLQSEEAKSLLVLCSLHKEDEDIRVEALLMNGIGLRIFHGIKKLKHVRNRVFHLVETLKSSSLLLDGNKNNTVRIHDVIRDVILSIASKDRQMYFVRNVEELNERINDDELEDSTAISLHFHGDPYNPIRPKKKSSPNRETSNLLPERLPCLKLQLFSLSIEEEYSTLEIPDQFFEVAKDLQVLELVSVEVNLSSSSSICFLKNLKTLTCSYCSVGDISSIGQLTCLEILDFSHSNVNVVPKELGNLSRLLSLDLNHCRNLEVIEAGVISSFRQLHELFMEGSGFTQWAPLSEDSREDRGKASLMELRQVRHLTTLYLDIVDADNVLPEDLFVDELERFKLRITSSSNKNHTFNGEQRFSRSLILDQVNDSVLQRSCLKPLIKKAENLFISTASIVDPFVDASLQVCYLQVLTLDNVHTVSSVIDTFGSSNMSAFRNLEELYLTDLEKLETICNGCDLSVEALVKLRVVVVQGCHSLKNLFPSSLKIRQLETLKVLDCKALEKIFIDEVKNRDEVIEFPLLHSIKLVRIPKLKQFVVGSTAIPKRNGDILPLFHHKVSFPTLKKLKLEALDSMEMIWPENDSEFMSNSYFCSLEKLFVIECMKLTRLCSSTMLRRLQGLTDVKVISCDMMKDVFEIRNPAVVEERLETIRIPISSLYIRRLPKLKHLFSYKEQCGNSGSSVIFGAETVEVSECSSLKSLFPVSVAKTLFRLKSICLENCEQLREVIADEEGSSEIVHVFVFSQLSRLNLENLPELECLYRKLHCSEWPSLSEIVLKECGKLKILASNLLTFQEKRRGKTHCAHSFFIGTVAFPKLKIVELHSLDQLEMIWQCDEELVIADSFGELEKLIIRDCGALTKVFSLDLLQNLGSLAELVIGGCSNLEEVFEMRRPTRAETSCGRVTSGLTSFILTSLPKLKHVWNHNEQCDPSGRQTFFIPQKLKEVVVVSCPSLEALFPASIAKELLELESLLLEGCDIMREVIAKEEGTTEIIPEFNLQKLTELQLINLPELQCLYPGLHSSKWPSLGTLTLENCGKLKTLVSDLSHFETTKSQQARGNIPLFMMETVMFPKLTSMSLESLDVGDNFEENNEYVPCTSTVERVNCSPNSKGFLFSSSTSFERLTMLAVLKCGFTVSLFDPSTARSLPQLTTLSITECKSITEVIGDAPEEGEMIVFSKLKTLVLACLPELASFHSGHCALLFPSLERLVVLQCAEMASFSCEVVAPKIKGIITRTRRIDRILCLERWPDGSFDTSDDLARAFPLEERWDGDINSTLQKNYDSPGKTAPTDTDCSEEIGDDDEDTASSIAEMETSADAEITELPDAEARTE